MTTSRKKQIPCREGLWTVPMSPAEKPQLIGSKCPNCGEVVFPVNPVCVNCQSPKMEDIKLSRKGTVWSVSTLHLRPPKYYKGPVPFDIGWVTLPEGASLLTRLLGAEPGSFKIGDEVELVIDVMQIDDEGNEILGFAFEPVK